MLHTKIPANCIDRIFQCPQSIDFGKGPINAPGAFRPNSLNSTPASLKGKIVDELAKCKFAKARFYNTDFQRFKKIYDANSNFKKPVTIGETTYEWGDKGISQYQLLGDRASDFMLKKLSGCQDVFCDRFDDLLCLFKGFPQVEFYKNANKQFVAYNPETDTEFAFGASVDFGGIDGDTTYLIELKTGSAFGKNLETQLKVSALACVLNHPEVNQVICGCYNANTDHYDSWQYSREELENFIPKLRRLLLHIYLDTQPEYITGVKEFEWCSNCDCKRCPYSRANKDNQEFQELWYEYSREEARIFSNF